MKIFDYLILGLVLFIAGVELLILSTWIQVKTQNSPRKRWLVKITRGPGEFFGLGGLWVFLMAAIPAGFLLLGVHIAGVDWLVVVLALMMGVVAVFVITTVDEWLYRKILGDAHSGEMGRGLEFLHELLEWVRKL